ncbi:MAG: hypothetical protein ACXABF_17350 [Candidatus Thorarchaeota archaeon]|jgi:hypothetical protein
MANLRDNPISEMNNTSIRPIKALSITLFLFGIFALVGSLFLWGEGFILNFPEGVDYSFPIADILVNAPANVIAAVGLWRLKRYGYVASQFCAGFYMYASVEIFVKISQGDLPASLEIILPQVIAIGVALSLLFYLWRVQEKFH